MSSKIQLGVDTGGTFTDVVARGADGTLRVHKLLSTPDDPSRAIADGVRAATAEDDAVDLVHGTTVATNALLERKGARIVLVTTEGFEDLLLIGRQNRPHLYALEPAPPAPLVPSEMVVGVKERLRYDGSAIVEIAAEEVARVVEAVKARAPDAVAICLLHSYANAAHERAVGDALRRALPAVHLSLSSEVSPEFREVERASTTAINAFVGPVMAAYLASLQSRLGDAHIEILRSSGGRATIDEASHVPAETVLSGPAGGVVGAVAAANEVGLSRIITFDMGGTSTDVSACDGEPALRFDAEIDGLPIRLPVLDIATVGAGGGSIAWVDLGGALRVGPASAGAQPGPACYGRGGVEATVTDAHVVLGHLLPERFLGGAMMLDPAAAERAVSRLAARLELSTEDCARGILDVADAAMVRAMKVVSIERGHDPRDYALVSFGGAGGLHACRLADALGIGTVLVPAHPGLLSAYGMLHADRERLYARSVIAPLFDVDLASVRAELAASARRDLGQERSDEFWYEVRYVGQSYELRVTGATADEVARRFGEEHHRLYGYRDDSRGVELVTVRLRARVVGEPSIPPPAAPPRATPSRRTEREVARGDLDEGEVIVGPRIIYEYSGTTVLPRGWSGTIRRGHLMLSKGKA